ncbi:Hsp20/alpha crystallin family protein [Bacillus sp. FSL W8-0848]|uniref:Hsp20/alpha crystallin family protein n=1 Tax=Bacillus sp. FSL W8-0848 TaxID=2954634 RepID=UPI0030F825AF
MDADKMKQWLDLAQTLYGGEFWKTVFDDEQGKGFTNGHPNFPFQTGVQQEKERKSDFTLIDIVDTFDEIRFLIYLPGFRKQDVELLSYETYFIVRGSRKSYFPEDKFKQREGKYGEFERKIDLDIPIDGNGRIHAVFKDGILYVTIPKDQTEARSITIRD